MVLRKLAISNFLVRKVRVALTVAAIALSVSLVVSVTSGYASIEAAAQKLLARYLATYDAQITRRGDLRGGIRASIVDELRADPDVATVISRLDMESVLVDVAGKRVEGRPAHIVGLDRPHDRRVENMELLEGAWFDSPRGHVAVIDQAAARRLLDASNDEDESRTLHVGDTFILPGPDRQLELTVVGIVQKPGILAGMVQTIYVPIETLREFAIPDEPDQVSRAMIELRGGVDPAQWGRRWRDRLAAEDPMLRLRLTSESKREMDQQMQGLHVMSYLGGTVAMLAATFIVFSALSMGVAERQRTLAMLRAIGAYRSQLGLLVVMEGLLLAVMGVMLGTPLGWFWVWLLSLRFEALFSAGVVLSVGGVAFAAAGSIAAALLASLLPAVAAMRLSPLEAMNPLATPPSARFPLWCALLGIVLASLDPIILFVPWDDVLGAMGVNEADRIARSAQFYLHFIVGLPGVMLGFFLLAPLFVRTVERVLGPIVATMFGLRYALLRQQLSSGIWRAAGTCAALMVGLAILVVMQTQGNSVISGWRLPDKFPDIFLVSRSFTGLGPAEQAKLEQIEGIRQGELLPIAIASPELGSNIFALAGAALMPDATMFFGVDPDRAMRMMELDFRHGNQQEAMEKLKQGRHVLVTDEFYQLKGLTVGDKLTLKTPRQGMVEYTIAGVVWSPGMDVFVSLYDTGRQLDQRTIASVFGSIEDARNDFGVRGVYLFAANLEDAVDKKELIQRIQQQVGGWGMQVGDVRQIKANIQQGFQNLLLLVSTIAFAAMAVAALGVTNTIMASIRSRRWQFGVLRSVGLTRWALLRIVLAEAMLLGVVACALGLAAGAEMVLNARQFSGITVGHYPPRIAVPWDIIGIGVAVVMGISMLASIWPAITVARTEPLRLLQAGRASA